MDLYNWPGLKKSLKKFAGRGKMLRYFKFQCKKNVKRMEIGLDSMARNVLILFGCVYFLHCCSA